MVLKGLMVLYQSLLDCYDIFKNEDASRGFWANVDMYLPDEQHEQESQINFSNVFARQLTNARELGQLQLLRFRKETCKMLKSNGKNESYLKLTLTDKNQAIFRPNVRHWEYGRLLKAQVEAGWMVTKVHRVLEYRQTRVLKNYVEDNQRMRQKATNSVDSSILSFLMRKELLRYMMYTVQR